MDPGKNAITIVLVNDIIENVRFSTNDFNSILIQLDIISDQLSLIGYSYFDSTSIIVFYFVMFNRHLPILTYTVYSCFTIEYYFRLNNLDTMLLGSPSQDPPHQMIMYFTIFYKSICFFDHNANSFMILIAFDFTFG